MLFSHSIKLYVAYIYQQCYRLHTGVGGFRSCLQMGYGLL